jgi:predicted ATPase
MARRDLRRFGPGPYFLGFRRGDGPWGSGFPFDIPAIAGADKLRLERPVTLFAGDNGTGKSTLIEAIAESMGFALQGGELDRAGEMPAVPRPVFDRALEPILTQTKPRVGYFLRAESFFNIARFIDSGSTFAPDLSLYGDVPLHEQSHGQSFLALASNRFRGQGLYLLDEPEAALSVSGELALLAVIVDAARLGAQLIIATHSPVLLACPDAVIFECDEAGVTPRSYEEVDAVRLTRTFLEAPERFLRAALDDTEHGQAS